jgi:hypothetical protein
VPAFIDEPIERTLPLPPKLLDGLDGLPAFLRDSTTAPPWAAELAALERGRPTLPSSRDRLMIDDDSPPSRGARRPTRVAREVVRVLRPRLPELERAHEVLAIDELFSSPSSSSSRR